MLSLLFSLFMRRNLQETPEVSQDGLSRYLPTSLTAARDQIATTALLASVAMSLYFSVIDPSYLLSLLFCFLQMNAILFYFFGAFPLGDLYRGSNISNRITEGYQ